MPVASTLECKGERGRTNKVKLNGLKQTHFE